MPRRHKITCLIRPGRRIRLWPLAPPRRQHPLRLRGMSHCPVVVGYAAPLRAGGDVSTALSGDASDADGLAAGTATTGIVA